MDNYKGFSLFNDIEDKEVQTYNRARIIINIMEDHMDKEKNKVTAKGSYLALSYFAEIPDEDKEPVTKELEKLFKSRGIEVNV